MTGNKRYGADIFLRSGTELRQKGVRILGDGKPAYNVHGQQIAFISPSDFFGSLVEIEQQQSRESGGGKVTAVCTENLIQYA